MKIQNKSERSLVKNFWNFTQRYAFPYKWWYFAGIVLIVATQKVVVMIIESSKNAVDAVMAEGANAGTVVPYSTEIALLALVLIMVRVLSRHFIFTPGRMIEHNIRNDYFQKLLSLSRNFFRHHETGDLVSRCSNDISHIRSVYGYVTLQIINVGAALFFGFTAMVKMDLETTLWLALPMVIFFTLIKLSISYMFRFWRLANQQVGELSSLALACYKGVSVIQGYYAEPKFIQKFEEKNQEYLRTNITVTAVRSLTFPMVKMVGGISLFIVLWVLGPKVIAKELSMGQVTAFIGYIGMVMPPLLSLGWMVNVLNRSIPAMERLDEILLAQPDNLEVRETLSLPDKQNHLKIDNLSYIYPQAEQSDLPKNTGKKKKERFALENISLEMTPGKVLGIVGETGAGKTSLIETILRLNDLRPKNIYLNKKDAAYTDIHAYQRYFSVAPQSPFLFSTTLRDNLRMALPYKDWYLPELDAKLLEYLSIAGFEINSEQLPDGLDTLVGEKGVMLSGGQRQRVALARCLLKEAPFYILDDVLSAVDHSTESLIIQNLKKLQNEKSFFIVSHRVSAVQWSDEILVLVDGKVIDRGSHQELIERAGFYREIYEYQQH